MPLIYKEAPYMLTEKEKRAAGRALRASGRGSIDVEADRCTGGHDGIRRCRKRPINAHANAS